MDQKWFYFYVCLYKNSIGNRGYCSAIFGRSISDEMKLNYADDMGVWLFCLIAMQLQAYPVISNVPVHFREPEISENPASLDFIGFIISFYMKCGQNRFLQICRYFKFHFIRNEMSQNSCKPCIYQAQAQLNMIFNCQGGGRKFVALSLCISIGSKSLTSTADFLRFPIFLLLFL